MPAQADLSMRAHEAPRRIADLPPFMPYFTEEEGFAAVYPELFARQEAAMKVEGFGPLKLLVYRNSQLRRLMIHPALAGNTPPAQLSEQAFYSVEPAEGREDEVRRCASALARYLDNQIFTLNPPLHQAYRHVLGRHLMGQAVENFVRPMKDTVEQMLDSVANNGCIDFISNFTGRVAARFWGSLIGLTDREELRIVELMDALLPMFNILMSSEDIERAGNAMQEYLAIVSGAVERAREKGGNALIQAVSDDFNAVHLQGDARSVGLPPESVGMLFASNLFDGFHTAGAAAASCVYRLLTNPAALEQVRRDRSLVPNAAFEGLRLDPPLTLSQRYAIQDFEFDGVTVPKETQVVMLWGAGNRDPEAFPMPDVYDLSRLPRGSTSFGGGVRMCMGRSVAQLLIETVIDAVTAPGMEVMLTAERYTLLPMSLMRQFDTMPVVIRRKL